MYVSLVVRVKGVVQGVGFRYFAYREAKNNDLVGYVRNLPDGTVETEVEGKRGNVESYLDAIQRRPVVFTCNFL